MEISVAEQGYALLQAFLLGGAVGVVYDFFRIMRVRVKVRIIGGLLDFLFWILVTVALFVHGMVAQNGVVRLYMVVAVFLGAVLYFALLSGVVLRFGYLLADIITKIWKTITWPIRLLIKILKKIKNNAKKLFHFWIKWYRIRLIHEGKGQVCPNDPESEEGGLADEVEKNNLFDENCGISPPSR